MSDRWKKGDPIPVSGKIVGDPERKLMHQAVDELWLTEGHFAAEFERKLEQKFQRRFAILTNSGSSANLLAYAALELEKGDEVITSALAFPTTVNPIIQMGQTPVFIDSEPGTYNINTDQLEKAMSSRTRAIVVAHFLGNPANMDAITEFARENKLSIIEDCCDAAGAKYGGKPVGSFSAASTYSFYPAHQITTGEGGAVLTDNPGIAKRVRSLRDWGRDCWCKPGENDTCGKRFAGSWDHKYTYSRIGWNLKSTDIQAAAGIAQLDRLDGFINQRKKNWNRLNGLLADLPIVRPTATEKSQPSWFGYAFGTTDRTRTQQELMKRNIDSRVMMGGNIIRQPAYREVDYRIAGSLSHADFAHFHGLWIGVWPGISAPMLDYISEVLHEIL